ncbi:MAG: glycosyltransferase family 4 protein [Bdellovibrionales bacterium]|nr:glycosyltransferase family 4 protein [Bdellovibrionales bacterium]
MQPSDRPIKILWMIPKWTLPVTDGARVATDSLIRNTISAGANVDVLCLPQQFEVTDQAEMKRAWGVNNIFVIPRVLPEKKFEKNFFYLWQLLTNPLVPLTFSSFSTAKLKKEVQLHISSNNYDYILLDGLHLGAALLNNGKFSKLPQIIYRAHNIEVDLWKKSYKEKKSPLLKLIIYFQSRLVEKFENDIINNSHGIAAISQEDLLEIQQISKTPTELVPLGLNFDSPLEACNELNTKFLFIGRLDWPPNKDGLEWLLKEVWPSVISNRPEAVLKIVGSGNGEWLKNYSHLKGVQMVGFVDSIRDAYRDCHFTIVPISYGSGTRIKVLESFALGRRLISTKMGVQGADLTANEYLNAETKEDWIKMLSSIKLDSEQQQKLDRARLIVAAKFGEKNIGIKFYKWLQTVL